MNNQLKVLAVICTLMFVYCTSVNYNNPLDSKGNSFDANKAKDDDGNGVPNIYEDDDNDGTLNIDDPDSKEHVVDTIKPFFSKPGNNHFLGNDTGSIAIGTSFVQKLATFKSEVKATDNIEGDITSRIDINSSSVSSISAGVYPVTFTVTDKDLNNASITRFVSIYLPSVEDKTAPVISFGNDTVYLMVGDPYVEQTATAFDLFEGKNVPVTSTGKVDTSKAGIYSIVYTAKDNSNNSVSKTKTVIIEAGTSNVDRINPELILKGKDSIEITTYAEFQEPGFTATDNHDGVITNKVKTDYGQFKAGAAAGPYLLKYTVQDSAGNSVTKTRFICLNCGSIDVLKPVFTVAGGDTAYSVLIRGKSRAVTAIDATDGNLTDSIKRTGTFDSTKSGVYTLTYTVSDQAENIATIHVTITIAAIVGDKDTTKPVITLKGKAIDTVGIDSVGIYTDLGATAKDSGKTIAVPTVSGAVDLKKLGSYTLTYTATDAAGNVATATRIVVVKEISKDLLIRYAVPSVAPLASVVATYNTHTIEGTGPAFANIKFMKIDWSLSQQKINDFAIQTSDGVPSYYFSLGSSVQTFGTAGSTLTLASTGITGFDGVYYVTLKGTNMVWVKKDGSFAIVWAPGL